MKKCDQIKDLILTDHIDGELDKGPAGELEGHLLGCSHCRAFLKEVMNNTAVPFRQVRQELPPEELWNRIRQNIEQEGQSVSPLADLMEKLKALVVFPRLVPVFASFVLMFLAGSVTLNTIHIQQAQAIDQGSYLVSLLSPPANGAAAPDNNDLGTPIEHYFL